MGIDPKQLRDLVIAPALAGVGLGGDAAAELVLGTFIQESACGRYLHQLGSGPAVGIGETEPETFDDINANFLAFRHGLKAKVDEFRIPIFKGMVEELEGNLYLAVIYTRLKYLRSPMVLPASGNLPGQAKIWKAVYNTASGAGTEADYIANWRAVFPA